MQSRTIQNMKFRRRSLGVTNYRKRLALVKSGQDRVVVRKTNSRILGQVVRYSEKGDTILVSADSNELMKTYKWPSRRNKPTAYLTGMLLAKKSKGGGELILDIGLSIPIKGSISFVFARGCVDGGMKLKGTFDVKEDQYNASSIAKYAELIKKDQKKYERQFGAYIKEKVAPESLPKLFNEVKAKIKGGS